jgi:hypothetical protein
MRRLPEKAAPIRQGFLGEERADSEAIVGD